MTVNIPAISRSVVKPRLLWIGQIPQSSGPDLRRLLQNIEVAFEPRLSRGAQRLRVEPFSAALVGISNSLCSRIADCESGLEEIFDLATRIPVVIWNPDGTVDDAIAYTRAGACHVLVGELDGPRLRSVIVKSVDPKTQKVDSFETASWRRSLIGNTPAMLELCEMIQLVAARRVTVTITGETGTGKEVVARAIHAASNRSASAMVAVNCTALPANLVESELFGHSKGAFTGAHTARSGRFEQAHRGTIFLDEIGDLPLEAQGKLLRVLQEKEFERVGSSETIRVDVRVIAATNIDLQAAARERRFREDLFYRLNVVPIHLPALRERREDIPLIVDHFLDKMAASESERPKVLSEDALDILMHRDWPGNVRQLQHVLEKACVLSGSRPVLIPSDFGERRTSISFAGGASTPSEPSVRVTSQGLDFDEVVARFELSILNQALTITGGNKARAADLLSIKRTTLLAKLRALEERSRPGSPAADETAVLVLHDDEPIRKLIARTLEPAGYRVLESTSPEAAAELLECWKHQIRFLILGSDGSDHASVTVDRLRMYSPNLCTLLVSKTAGRRVPESDDPRREWLATPFSNEELIRSLKRLSSNVGTTLAACSI